MGKVEKISSNLSLKPTACSGGLPWPLGVMTDHTTTDSAGQLVRVGTRVRITHIQDSTIAPLSQLERDRVLSMLGETFNVYEVDKWGQAWVEKWWHEDENLADSHSLGLEPQQMLVAQNET